jgi:curved DNA-binding protein CbpA
VADALQGNVAEKPFPKVIYALVAHRFTGALTLRQDGKSYVLWWRDGAIVDADSAAPEDSLGRVLVTAGLIDAGQVAESLRRMAQNPGMSQLTALAEIKALEGDAVQVAARTGLSCRALRTFALPQADYVAEPQEHQRGEGPALDGRWLIFKGLRAHYDAARLGHDLAPLEPYAVKLLPGAESGLGLFGFGDEERYVLAYLAKGYWSLPDLVDACVSLPQTAVHSLVYALLACELLDVKPANSVPRLRKRAREQTMDVSAAAARAIAGGAAPAAMPVRGPASIPPPTPPSTTPPIARPASAPEPGLRDAILKKFKDVEAGADLFTVLELPVTCSGADVKAAYFRLAKTFHPDRAAGLKVEDLRPQIERVFARMSEAFATLGDDAKRAEYRKIQAAGGEEAVRKKELEEEARAMKILEAEEHFRLGEMALRRNQFAVALDEFKKALAKNPDEPEHHAMVAWATWMNTSDKTAALQPVKQMFARALELNDKCVPAYFYLGHIYNFQQDYPRAIAQFKRALQLRPGFTDAEREIRLLEMRQRGRS